MMDSTSISRHVSPHSPPSGQSSTLPTTPEKFEVIDFEREPAVAELSSTELDRKISEHSVFIEPDGESSINKTVKAPRRQYAEGGENHKSDTDQTSTSPALEAFPAIVSDGVSPPITRQTTLSFATAPSYHRRESITSVASTTPSEHALLNQTFWGFSYQYLKSTICLMLGVPSWGAMANQCGRWWCERGEEGGVESEGRQVPEGQAGSLGVTHSAVDGNGMRFLGTMDV